MKIAGNEMEFDLIGVEPSLANAFRRILIAEVNNYYLFMFTLFVDILNFKKIISIHNSYILILCLGSLNGI